PQLEHSWLDGKVLPTLTMVLPYHSALYVSMLTNSDQDASAMDLARLWFFTMFLTCKSSKQITWFSRISLVDSLCRKSRRALTIFSWILATLILALCQLEPPFVRLERIRCQRANCCSYLRKNLEGFTFVPSERMANSFKPRSIPTALFLSTGTYGHEF